MTIDLACWLADSVRSERDAVGHAIRLAGCMFPLAIAGAAVMVVHIRRHWSGTAGAARCRSCKYPLTPQQPRCPECGEWRQ